MPHWFARLRDKSMSKALSLSYMVDDDSSPRLLSVRRRRRMGLKQHPRTSVALSNAFLQFDEQEEENESRISLLQFDATFLIAIVVDVVDIFVAYFSMQVMPL